MKAGVRALAAASLLTLLLQACGYGAGFRLQQPDELVGIEFFDNRTPVPGLEVELHAELAEAMHRMVQAPVVAPGDADLVLRGVVVTYAHRQGIRTTGNQLQESGVQIAVRAMLVRRGLPPPKETEPRAESRPTRGRPPPDRPLLRPGEQLLREVSFRQESGFRLVEPGGELDARERVLRSLSERIILDLFSSLAYEATP